MDPVLKKLQYREGKVVVLDAPDEAQAVIDGWAEAGVSVVDQMTPGSCFVLAFVRSCAQIDEAVPGIVAGLAPGDPVLWMAYPKKSSRRYRSDVARDGSWQALGEAGFEAVRQVAIDADWSALRFRRVERISSMRRDVTRALTDQGRLRTTDQRGDPPGP